MRALDTQAELSEALMRQILEALQSERAQSERAKVQPATRAVDLDADPYDFIIEQRR